MLRPFRRSVALVSIAFAAPLALLASAAQGGEVTQSSTARSTVLIPDEANAISTTWLDFTMSLAARIKLTSLTGPFSSLSQKRIDPQNYTLAISMQPDGIYEIHIYPSEKVFGDYVKGGGTIYKYDPEKMMIVDKEWTM